MKRGIKYAGLLIIFLSFSYIFQQIRHLWGDLSQAEISSGLWIKCLFLSIVYGVYQVLLSLAWWKLLCMLCSGHCPSFSTAFRIFMRTQIWKYLPGNVFHFVGRIELMKVQGVRRAETTISLMYESSLLLVCGSLLGGISALGIGVHLEAQRNFSFIWAGAGIAALVVFLWVLQRWRPGPLKDLPEMNRERWVKLVQVVLLYLVYFMLYSLIMWIAVAEFDSSFPYWTAVAAVCFPWAIGFVVPGASGGIGVREAAMMFILTQFLSPVDSLILTTFMRIVTTIGDGVGFLFSFLIRHDYSVATGAEHYDS